MLRQVLVSALVAVAGCREEDFECQGRHARMRIGLVGVGRIGAFHAATLQAIPEIDSLVLADFAPGRADEVAARLGVESVGSAEELLAAGVDGLVIAAATDAHSALILAGVDAGVPTFCEKPVALDIDATIAVLDKVEGS